MRVPYRSVVIICSLMFFSTLPRLTWAVDTSNYIRVDVFTADGAIAPLDSPGAAWAFSSNVASTKTEANATLALIAVTDTPSRLGNVGVQEFTFALKYDDGYLVRGTGSGVIVAPPDYKSLDLGFYNHISLSHLTVVSVSPQGRSAINRPRVGDLIYGMEEMQLDESGIQVRGAFRLLRSPTN